MSPTPLRALCALVAMTSCNDASPTPPRYPPPEPHPSPGFASVWAEFMTPAQVDAAVPLLRDYGLAVNLAWPVATLDDAERLKRVADAAAVGVEVRPWLLLERADGYWPGSTNASLFASTARRLLDLWADAGLEPTVLIVDMEMHIARADAMAALLRTEPLDLLGLISLLRAGVDRAQFEAATAEYRALVDEAHARGWQVLLTTLPQLLDDDVDGDDTIRQALGTPIDGIDWDLVSFQVYRTMLSEFAGAASEPLTPFVVYDYARDAVARYGDRAALDLGLVQAGVGDSDAYVGPEDLRADLAAAHAAGVPAERIQVYNLDGILDRAPAAGWLAPPETAPVAPETDLAANRLRALIRALDAAN